MALHLPRCDMQPAEPGSDCSASEGQDEDNNFDDWVSESITCQCPSLFDEQTFPSVNDAQEHDKIIHNFDLSAVCSKLSLDFHGRVRLINYIRKNKIAPDALLRLTGSEAFDDDKYLLPVLENDPLLQAFTDDWSDSDDSEVNADPEPARKIHVLEKRLERTQQSLADYRALISQKLDIVGVTAETAADPIPVPARDDDSHYFESYGGNEIHAIMIKDQVRTTSYARFILTSPSIFQDAVVLDMGCGTGILSLFATRAGAKRVYAVDASSIADKARQIVADNGLDHIITVLHGKIEEIELPGIEEYGGKVDVIVSEWMGYALLYESMLDSVLCARDRWLREGGLMAPSQCRMMLGLCDAGEIWKERIGFWDDVYGFDMSCMAKDLYDEAIIDVVGPNTMLSAPCIIKDLHLSRITPASLSFSSPFILISAIGQRTRLSAFVLYFDTFFTNSGEPIPEDTQVKVVKEGEVATAELWPVGGRNARDRRQSLGQSRKKSLNRDSRRECPNESSPVDEADGKTRKPVKETVTSFSTGPESVPTHWKQTLFLLREPVMIVEGSVVKGVFHCRKSDVNSRELDVEIHYSVQKDARSEAGETVVQMFKVR